MRILLLAVIVMIMAVSVSSAEAKSLIVVYSRADENYNVGTITTGNTMKLAQIIAEKTGAEIFEGCCRGRSSATALRTRPPARTSG